VSNNAVEVLSLKLRDTSLNSNGSKLTSNQSLNNLQSDTVTAEVTSNSNQSANNPNNNATSISANQISKKNTSSSTILIKQGITLKKLTYDAEGNLITNNHETGYYDEIEIEDMDYDEETNSYTYPCPCGDKFIISVQELADGEQIAKCPSCSLQIKVIYDIEGFQ